MAAANAQRSDSRRCGLVRCDHGTLSAPHDAALSRLHVAEAGRLDVRDTCSGQGALDWFLETAQRDRALNEGAMTAAISHVTMPWRWAAEVQSRPGSITGGHTPVTEAGPAMELQLVVCLQA